MAGLSNLYMVSFLALDIVMVSLADFCPFPTSSSNFSFFSRAAGVYLQSIRLFQEFLSFSKTVLTLNVSVTLQRKL